MRAPKIHKLTCSHCDGTGKAVDSAAMGPALRSFRRQAGIRQGIIARDIGVSGAILCDLEYGRRAWSFRRVRLYIDAVQRRTES